jgi:DNA-directed RNA polymerase specialized sigma24 family protein
VTLGDRGRAGAAAGQALAEGAARAGELRHPERAAAWLRARVLHLVDERDGAGGPGRDERAAVLRGLGASDEVMAGLAGLSLPERSALVASVVERFDPRDAETIVGVEGAELRHLVLRARQRYLLAALAEREASSEPLPVAGEIAAHVDAIAARAMGREP